jgi:hypothetical protein
VRLLPVLVFACCGVAFGQAHNEAGDCSADGSVINGVTGALVPHARVAQRPSGSVGAITGADGKWALSGTYCGPVQFTASHPGFISGIYGRRGIVSDPGSQEAVLLEPGSITHDLQIQLLPESSIEGSVVDEFGSGLNKAQVTLFRSEVNLGRRVLQHAASGQTDSLGHYRIGDLRAGQYLACASVGQYTYPVGGGKALAYSERCYPGAYPGASASGAASTITLGAAAALQVDFNMTPIRIIDIRGEIRGLPQSFWHPSPLTVVAPPLRLYRSGGDMAAATPTRTNNRDSVFTLSGVTPGAYRLHGAVKVDGQTFFASTALDAGDSDMDGVVVQFVPGVSVTGAVRLEAAPNSIEPPLVFAAISVSLVPQDRVASNYLPVAWDASRGSFTYSGVEPGVYLLRVVPPAPWYVKSIRLNNEDLRGKEFDISGAAGPIEITLSDGGGSIEGSLADQDGKPVEGTIFLFGHEPASPAITETTDGGKFTFRDLAPGDYHVCAFDEGYKVEYADPAWLQRNGGPGEAVTITAASATQVSLTRRTVPQ